MKKVAASGGKMPAEHTVLVLQGGGALGATPSFASAPGTRRPRAPSWPHAVPPPARLANKPFCPVACL